MSFMWFIYLFYVSMIKVKVIFCICYIIYIRNPILNII